MFFSATECLHFESLWEHFTNFHNPWNKFIVRTIPLQNQLQVCQVLWHRWLSVFHLSGRCKFQMSLLFFRPISNTHPPYPHHPKTSLLKFNINIIIRHLTPQIAWFCDCQFPIWQLREHPGSGRIRGWCLEKIFVGSPHRTIDFHATTTIKEMENVNSRQLTSPTFPTGQVETNRHMQTNICDI